MNVLNDKILYEISGGGLSKSAMLGLAALGVFIVGVFDGFFRPLKCNR